MSLRQGQGRRQGKVQGLMMECDRIRKLEFAYSSLQQMSTLQ